MPPYDPSCHPGLASSWVRRFAHLVPPGASLLDLACGGGRHGRFFMERGVRVTFVDIAVNGVADLAGRAEILACDLEKEPWPFAGRRFDVVLVVNYLHRPLAPALLASLGPDGLLLYETFAAGNELYDRPRNPDHLLRRGELLELAGGLQIVAYEDGVEERPTGRRVVQRVCARAGAAPVPLAAD